MIKITVYIDILFFINFLIDFVLLKISCSFLKYNYNFFHNIIASSLGGIFSVIYFLIKIPFPLNFILTLIMPFIMCLILIWEIDFKKIIKSAIVFYIISAVFSGVIYTLTVTTGLGKFVLTNNGNYYIHIPLFYLILCVLAILLISFFENRTNIKSSKSKIIKVGIKIDNNFLKVNTFFDSGNNLYEPLSKTPVILIEYSKLKDFFAPMDLNNLNFDLFLEYNKKISCKTYLIKASTVSGSVYFLGIKPDEIFIITNKKSIKINAIIAIVNRKFTDNDEYNGIFHPDLLI